MASTSADVLRSGNQATTVFTEDGISSKDDSSSSSPSQVSTEEVAKIKGTSMMEISESSTRGQSSGLEKGKKIDTQDARITINPDYDRTFRRLSKEIKKIAEEVEELVMSVFPHVSVPPSECFIYRTPEHVRNLHKAAYTPRVVSIGPYHYRRYKSMEGVKKKYCLDLIRRSNKISIIEITKLLTSYEGLLRDSYSRINLSSTSLFAMILIDGCFILEYMLRTCYDKDLTPNINIEHDLLLQENQIPFEILKFLFISTVPIPKVEDGAEILVLLVRQLFRGIRTSKKDDEVPKACEVMHITDLVRKLYEPMKPTPDLKCTDSQVTTTTPRFTTTASRLYEAGVKFKNVPGKGLLDIEFKNQCLEIPTFEIDENQLSLYRNLMVLELCHYPNNTFITDYFVFMDTLIDSSDDIFLLVKNGVLFNKLGHYSDTANIFNNFCGGITNRSDTSYLMHICEELNAYYKVPSNTWLTTFKRDYFGTPLRGASTTAAVMLLVLTFLSTIYTIKSYKN